MSTRNLRTFWVILFIASLALHGSLRAQNVVSGAGEFEHDPKIFSFSTGYSHVFQTDIDKRGHFDVHQFRASLKASVPVEQLSLGAFFSYEFDFYDFSGSSRFQWDEINQISFGPMLRYALDQQWSVFGGAIFEFTMNYNSGNQRRKDICVLVQSMLNNVGIKIGCEEIISSVYFANLRQKDFDAGIAGWSAALFVDPKNIWGCGPEHAFNFPSYCDERVDQIIREGGVELDREKRRQMWREMQQLIYHDQPYTFLYWRSQPVLIHRRFKDVRANILARTYKLEEWWVPKEFQKYNDPDRQAGSGGN